MDKITLFRSGFSALRFILLALLLFIVNVSFDEVHTKLETSVVHDSATLAISGSSTKIFGKDEVILVGCTPANFLQVVPSDFGFPPNVLNGSLSATNVDLSAKWGLDPGSILVSVEGASTISNGDRFFVIDGQNTIFRFTGSVAVFPRPGHSRRIQAMKRDGFLALDGTKYELITPLPDGVISANVDDDYYVENTTSTDIQQNSYLWQAKSEAESLLFYTTSVDINDIHLWLRPVTCLDTDGDGVLDEDEENDGTDPEDSCDFFLSSQSVAPSDEWLNIDCDGDGVTNQDEVDDSTDPLDPCDLFLTSQTISPTAEWNAIDCDDDGNPNGTDPNPLIATAADDTGSTPANVLLLLNILENDDYLPNNDPDNLGITSLVQVGGNASGMISFDSDLGTMSYTAPLSEINSIVTIIYQVCNIIPEPYVCATATITINVTEGTLIAVDDVAATPEDTAVEIDVLANDSGVPTDGTLTVTDPANGTVTINDGGTPDDPSDDTVTYTPDPSIIGEDSFEYTICDGAGNCDTATVTVEVGTPDAPRCGRRCGLDPRGYSGGDRHSGQRQRGAHRRHAHGDRTCQRRGNDQRRRHARRFQRRHGDLYTWHQLQR